MASAEIEAKEESELTNEERLAWLRARGVLIEEPASKKSTASAGDRKFRYVKIPCDDDYAIEELSASVSEGDALPAVLGPKFAGGDMTDEELLAHAAKLGHGSAVSAEAMRAVMAQGGAESFRLAVPTEGNGREGVYAYLDEASAMKSLPENRRATALAGQCGFPADCILRGDIYVGRQKWSRDGLVENTDFLAADLESNSLWLRRAATENLQFQKDTRPEDHDRAQAGASSENFASGQGDGYSWKDEPEELEVLVHVEAGTSKKDVKIEFKKQEIRISKPVSLSLKLLKPVDVDGCNWTLGNGQLILTLEKATAQPWPQLCA